MKIKDLRDPLARIVDVFSIYWFEDEAYFLGLLKEHGGLMSYKASQVSIINSEINFHAIFFKNGIYHWALIKETLLDNILEHDEFAYKRFLDILKAEGHVDKDFY